MIADEYGITREDLDAFGAQSQQRAVQATAEGRFDNELIAVPFTAGEGDDADQRRSHR